MGQQEIVSYSNADGRQFRAADRRRQYDAQKALRISDVPVGSKVALHCDPEAATQPVYRTPFWLGDVVEAVEDPSTGKLVRVTIH